MKKYLVYYYLGVMFTCVFGAGSLSDTYQEPVLVFGVFLFGLFFVIGMPALWRKKVALRGRGLNVEFSKHPIIYTSWLLFLFGFGLVMVACAMIYTISHAFGIVLVPWLW
jgi:hypothetical protein